MKTVKLQVIETLKYNREVIVEIPDEMTDGQLESVLDRAERTFEGVSGFVYGLRKHGIKNPDGVDEDLSSPDSIEAECQDYEILEVYSGE